MATSKPSLKLLVNKATKKVLFAEAGKDFTDFLFTLLAMPIGTVVHLLRAESMVGSVGNVYSSLENMSYSYLIPSVDKDELLNPTLASGAGSSLLPLQASPEPDDPDPQPTNYYRCPCTNYSACNNYITGVYGTICPQCRHSMSNKLTVVPEVTVEEVEPEVRASTTAGYVQGVVTYMVMDDLSVSPMSTISSIALLNRFNIHDVGCLEERAVKVSMEQGLAILKAALQSKTVLSDVFIRAKTASA